MAEYIAKNLSAILRELQLILEEMNFEQMDRFLGLLRESSGIFLSGAGRSGLMIRAFAMRLGHLGLPAHLTGGVLAPPIKPGQLLVIASGSGETTSLVTMARKARDLDAVIALITANPSSTLAQMSECVITLEAPAPKTQDPSAAFSVQPMGSLFEQAMFLFCESTIMELMRLTGQDAGAMIRRNANLE